MARLNIAMFVPLAGLWLAGCQSVAVLSDPDALSESKTIVDDALQRANGILGGPDTSIANQKALGDRLAAQALDRVRLAEDDALEAHLTAMATRIASKTNARELDFRVYVVEDGMPNAFTPGGGHIFVTTGLVARLKTESQMAMVLSHEIAHNADAHIVKGAHRRAFTDKATAASKTVFDEGLGLSWVGEKVGQAIDASVNLYTSDQEDAADEDGLDYMIAAGYHPGEAVATFDALMGGQGQVRASPLDLMGGETDKERRITRLNNLLKAKYDDRDFSNAILSTPTYDRLAGRYAPPGAETLGAQ